MLVLVSLILFGTITMINLFTAVIISDLNNLEKDVFVQNLSNMAQCAILAEAILPNKLLKGFIFNEMFWLHRNSRSVNQCVSVSFLSRAFNVHLFEPEYK